MVQYFKVLLKEEKYRKPNSIEKIQEEFGRSIIFHYHVINTNSHLFLLKRICNSKADLYQKLIDKGIYPISISNTKCNRKDKMYNVYFQSGSKIIVNNLNIIKK